MIPYRTKFRRAKYFIGHNFRQQAEISTNFCLTFVSKYCTKFSTDKIFRRTKFSTPSRNFDSFVRFLTDFCIEILDKIFNGQNFSSDNIFDTKPKFRQLCPTNFCPIRYPCIPVALSKYHVRLFLCHSYSLSL